MRKEKLLACLEEISSIDAMMENRPFSNEIAVLEDMICGNQYKIAVIGEFSAGKSTFVNALLGEELLFCSNRESTGAVTTIQHDTYAHVQAYGKDRNLLREFNLETEEDRKLLNSYLDILSKKGAENVNIFYPMEGIDSDILFLDTPGIEKMSRAQLEMTKMVLEQANAVLFLINKEGFTEAALQVITGRHEVMGKLRTEDIFVIMTHIGEVYDDRMPEAAREEVARLVKDAEDTLTQSGVSGISIFPVDSKEYLWGCNNRLYEEEKRTRDVSLKGELLSQEEYRDRSRFDLFRQDLTGFLRKDNRNANWEKDIRNKMNLILDSMMDKLSGDEKTYRGQTEVLVAEYDRRIENACTNQRKFYNRIVRNLQENLSSFSEALEEDERKEMSDKGLSKFIDQTFRTMSDLNDDNFRKCAEMEIRDMERVARETESRINKHVELLMEKVLKKIFDEEFRKMFDRKVDIALEASLPKFESAIDGVDENVTVGDADLKKLEREKEEADSVLCQLERQYAQISPELLAWEKKKIQRQKNEIDRWYMDGLERLGNRPGAVQKFKKVKKTKGALFWKKTKTEKVPDGMDTSAQKEWDKKQKRLLAEYDEKCDKVEEEQGRIDSMARESCRCNNQIKAQKNRIKGIEEQIRFLRQYIEEEKRRSAQAYLDRQKERIASYCELLRGKRMDQLKFQTDKYLYEIRRDLERRVKEETEKRIEEYKKELREKNRKLYEEITVTADTRKELMRKITLLREELGNEEAV